MGGAQIDVALEDGRVHIAEFEYLFLGQPLFQELLFNLYDFAIRNGAQCLDKLLLDTVLRFSGVKLENKLL